MDLLEFEKRFSAVLGDKYKTADLDRFNRCLIKEKADVSCLRSIILEKKIYHRTFFQVSLAELTTIEEKFEFIELHFDKLQDWWHVDQLSQFVDKKLCLDFALPKAVSYVKHPLPFARRWGYVLFMPSLVKLPDAATQIFPLFHNDDEYYVQMAEAWLLSYLAVYEPEKTFSFLEECDLSYNITGKAIQKICDSFRIEKQWKEKFKTLRNLKFRASQKQK